MKSFEQETIKAQLNDEQKALKDLESAYKKAKKDCQEKIRNLNARKKMNDPNLQTVIHQQKYQKELLKEIDGVLNDLQTNSYQSVNEFFQGSYVNGYVGSMYEFEKQGIPITTPVDPKKVVTAIQTKSKLSQSYYMKQGLTVQNIRTLKKQIALECTRGIASGKSWIEVADSLTVQRCFDISRSDAMRIVRTEGNRINQQGRLDAGDEAIKQGCDLVKQWDATLDDRTRPDHQVADGQLREWDEDFLVGGEHMKAPSIGGSAKQVINCRCQLLKRPRWALDEEELKELQDRANYFGLDKTADFEEFKNKYLQLPSVTEQEKQIEEKIKFTPAKNVKEAEEYARTHFADDVSYSGLSVKNANTINEELTRIFNEYDLRRLEEIKTGKGKAVMSANWRTLHINPRNLGKALDDSHINFLANQQYYKDSIALMESRWVGKKKPASIEKQIEKLKNKLLFTRFGVPEMYPNHIAVCVDHEFGHVIADQYFGQINDSRVSPAYSLNWSYRAKSNKVDSVYLKAKQNGDIYLISEYGGTNSHEFFAECFAMRLNGEKLPDYIEEMMEGVISGGIMQ